MRVRTSVSVFTLIAFLPLATGCSARHTSYIQDDPVTDATTSKLADGDQVRISGYATRSDGFHRWKGDVSVAGPDTLEFQPSNIPSVREPPFRLARTEVTSLEVETIDGARTVATAAIVAGTLALVLLVALARAISEGFTYSGKTTRR